MPTSTEAYVARGSTGGVRLERVQYADPAPDEVLVRVVAAALCHSDVRAAAGTFLLAPPLVLGHEAAGYVLEAGRDVAAVRPGDAVVLAYASCGRCRRCVGGQQPYCDELFALNFRGVRGDGEVVVRDEKGEGVNGLFFGQSSMSRVALVRESCCVKVECDQEELKLFASLGCGVETGAGAILNVAKPPVGSSIVVFGAGAVGLSAIMAAKLSSPACLVLVETSQTKIDMIPDDIFKGVQVLNPGDASTEELVKILKQMTPTGAGMDFALDCVGDTDVMVVAHASLDRLGMLLNVGSSATARSSYLASQHLIKGATTRGTHQGDSVPRIMIPQLIDLWRRGKFPFDKLLTKFRFDELLIAMEETREGRVIKPLLLM